MGVESTIGDMARYLEACIDPREEKSGRAFRLAQTAVVHVVGPKSVGFGWIRWTERVVWLNGVAGGFSANLAADQESGRGLVLLTNTQRSAGNDLIHRLNLLVRDGR